MTIENRLIKEAKAKPEFVSIRVCDVRKIARHAKNSIGCYGMPQDLIELELLAGKIKILGVPIRVGS